MAPTFNYNPSKRRLGGGGGYMYVGFSLSVRLYVPRLLT